MKRANSERPPAFANEAEQRAYWQRTDSVDQIDWSKAEAATLSILAPSAAPPGTAGVPPALTAAPPVVDDQGHVS